LSNGKQEMLKRAAERGWDKKKLKERLVNETPKRRTHGAAKGRVAKEKDERKNLP